MAADKTSATFTMNLGNGISGPARAATSDLEALKKKMADDQAELRELTAAMAKLKAGGLKGGEAFTALQERSKHLRADLAQTQSAFVSAGGSFGRTRGGLRALLTEAAGAPGPLGSAARGALGLGSALASPVAMASAAIGVLVGLGVAVVGFAATVTAAAATLLRYGLAHADARRAELLHLEGLATLRTAYQHQVTTGAAIQQSIDRVADSSALARPEIVRLAEGLHTAGLRGRALTEGLEAVAIAQSVQGDRGAARWRAQVLQAARLGESVSAVAARVRSQLGPIAERQALTWDRQLSRLQESFGHLFDDLHVERPLEALHEFTSAFSQSSATGRALRQMLSTLFNPLLDQAGESGTSVRRIFQYVIIGALRAEIALLTFRNRFRAAFSADGFEGIGLASGEALAKGLVSVDWLGLGARVFGAIRSGLQTNATITGQFLVGLGRGLGHAAADAFVHVGTSIVAGITRGIRSSVATLRAEVTQLGTSATSALTGALGIHSPSRVFAELGVQIPRGVAEGVDRGTGAAATAVATMGGALADAPIGAGTSTSTSSTVLGPFYVSVEDRGGDPTRARQRGEEIGEGIAAYLERLGIVRGRA